MVNFMEQLQKEGVNGLGTLFEYNISNNTLTKNKICALREQVLYQLEIRQQNYW